MSGWNFADVYEAVAAKVPDRPCQIQGSRTITWRDFDRRAERARRRPDRRRPHPAVEGRRVPLQLSGVPRDLLRRVQGAASRRSTPTTATGPKRSSTCSTTPTPRRSCSTPSFTELLDGSATGCRRCGAGTSWPTRPAPVPSGRRRTRRSSQPGADRSVAPWGRSGDDLLLLYTGGTTGMPKGVMWRQDDLFNVLGAGGNAAARRAAGRAAVEELAARHRRRPRRRIVMLARAR